MESNITIYKPDLTVLANITFDTKSFMRWQVMGEHSITLYFSLPQVQNNLSLGLLEIPVGSYVIYKGQRYTLYNPSDFVKNSTRDYNYTLKLHAPQELLNDAIFINEPDGRTSFSRQARPSEFLEAIVRNMNRYQSGDWDNTDWTAGISIKDEIQKNIQFNNVTVFEALKLVTEAFKTEWQINNQEISLCKVEHFKDNPLKLSYGGGQTRDLNNGGFVSGVGRNNFDNSRPVSSLYVIGGDRNIEFKTYGSQTLHLPKDGRIAFDGTYFEDEVGFNSTIARRYKVNSSGTFISNVDNTDLIGKRESSIEIKEAYPKWEGEITDIKWIYKEVEYSTYQEAYDIAVLEPETETSGVGAIFCDVFDITIPNELNFAKYRLDGEQLFFTPQTGRLSGIDLGIQQEDNAYVDEQNTGVSGYIHSERRFKLLTEADYGSFIPDNRLQIGDKYAIFGMAFRDELADIYIRNDISKSGGEWDLMRQGVRYLYENEDFRFTFKGKLDSIWAKKNWDWISGKLVAGGYVDFIDNQFQPNGILIRISAIKEFLYEPEAPEIELTNIVIGGGLRGGLAEIPKQEVISNEQQKEISRLEQRRWRDVQELRNQFANIFPDFSEAISPVSVASMQFIAGNAAGQFRYVDTIGGSPILAPTIEYNSATNTVIVSGAYAGATSYIQHQNIDSNGNFFSMDGKSSSGHAGTTIRLPEEYKYWTLGSFESEPMDKTKLYWVYAKVDTGTSLSGEYVVTTDIHSFEENGEYWLVVGALNSEYEGSRGFSPLFGFTEILPGQITTGMIRSSEGNSYFDLTGGNFHIGNNVSYMDWNTIRETLIIQNAGLEIGSEIALNQDGSGHLAGGKIRWDSNGTTYIQDARLTDVTINGSVSQPWVIYSPTAIIGVNGLGRHDNIAFDGFSPNTITSTSFPWTIQDSGRTLNLCLYRWTSNVPITKAVIIQAPSGKYFFENGKQYTSIRVSRELITLVGYGSPTEFYGWIVQNRTLVMPEGKYGGLRRVLYQGFVYINQNNPSMSDVRLWSADNNLGMSQILIGSVDYLGTGNYRIGLPVLDASNSINYGTTLDSIRLDDFQVFTYSINHLWSGGSINSQAVFPTVTRKLSVNVTDHQTGTNRWHAGFEVLIGNGSQAVNSSFMFEVVGCHDWVKMNIQ